MYRMDEQQLLIAIIVVLLVLKYQRSQTKQLIAEHFTNDEMRAAIKEVYDADVAAIKNLSDIAAKLLTDKKLTVPGALDIKDNVNIMNEHKSDGNWWRARAPNLTKTPGWGGGIHTWDCYVEGAIGLGKNGEIPTVIGPTSANFAGTINAGAMISSNTYVNAQDKITERGFALIPPGVIVAWSGDISKPPGGWALCDGNNNTPDLRGRFIRMYNADTAGNEGEIWRFKEQDMVMDEKQKIIAGTSRSVGKTWILKHSMGDRGGTDHHVMDASEMPAHKHKADTRGDRGDCDGRFGLVPEKCARNRYDSDGLPDDTAMWTGTAGKGFGHNNMPPYYVLAYIMKIY